MYNAGIDYHKKYSVVSIIDEDGKLIKEVRISHQYPDNFRKLFSDLDGRVKVVYESGFNWSWLYEIVEGIENVESITLANPYKVRLIAEAQIKTDKISSRALAMLLRLNVVPECHVPSHKTRQRKEVLRQRVFWVQQRTRIRNRIHKIIDRQHNLQMPQVTDMFGRKGREALDKAVLPEPDMLLLRQNLAMLDQFNAVIKEDEQRIKQDGQTDRTADILNSIPGIALIIGNIVAAETDGIKRFREADRYVAYSGLAPSTYSSGDKTYNGRMINQCNKWLKCAFIEAAWVAVGCSAYFGGLYRQHRARGKKANTAITIVARRMCRIVWRLLTEDRFYREDFFPAALIKD